MKITSTQLFSFELHTAAGRQFNLGVQAESQLEAVRLLRADLEDLAQQLKDGEEELLAADPTQKEEPTDSVPGVRKPRFM